MAKEVSTAIADGEMGVQGIIVQQEVARVVAYLAAQQVKADADARSEFEHQRESDMYRLERGLPENKTPSPTDLRNE